MFHCWFIQIGRMVEFNHAHSMKRIIVKIVETEKRVSSNGHRDERDKNLIILNKSIIVS